MNGIISWVTGNISSLLIGASIPLVWKLAQKKIPAIIGKLFADKLSDGFKKINLLTDQTLKGLYTNIAVDLVKLAEYLIPDAKTGEQKYALVAAKLCKIIPFLNGQDEKIKDIIEMAVIEMKKELAESVK